MILGDSGIIDYNYVLRKGVPIAPKANIERPTSASFLTKLRNLAGSTNMETLSTGTAACIKDSAITMMAVSKTLSSGNSNEVQKHVVAPQKAKIPNF